MVARVSVVLGWAVSRAILVLIPLGVIAYPSGDRVADDVTLYAMWSEIIGSGAYPTGDPMWQYPPLAGFVFWLGTSLTANPLVGFELLALFADAAVFGVLLTRGLRTGRLIGAWTWVIGGAAIGPVLLTRFDIFPTLFAVLALLAAARPVRAGVLLGVGTLLKLWPILLVITWPRRRLPPLLAAVAATTVGGMLVLATHGPGVLSFLSEQRNRGLQIESVGAAPFVLARMIGVDVPAEYRFGCMEVATRSASIVALIVSLVGVVGLAVIAYRRFRGALDPVPVADLALTVILVSIATSRVFSPQFMIWVAGIAAVCLLNPRTLMRPVIALLLPVAVLGQCVYPALYGQMITGAPLGASLQLLRIALLIAATGWALARVWRAAPTSSSATTPTTSAADRSAGSARRADQVC